MQRATRRRAHSLGRAPILRDPTGLQGQKAQCANDVIEKPVAGARALSPGLPNRRRMLVATLVVASAVVTRGAFAETEREIVKPFVGAYRYVGGKEERNARDRAIDQVVSELNFFVRGIARSRLEEATEIHSTLSITATKSFLRVKLGGRAYIAPLNGRPVKAIGLTGTEVTLRYVIRQGSINQRFTAEDGGRDNRLTLKDDHLIMHVRVYSERLPKDLEYRLTYQRR